MIKKRKRWSAERKAALREKINAKIAAGWRPFQKLTKQTKIEGQGTGNEMDRSDSCHRAVGTESTPIVHIYSEPPKEEPTTMTVTFIPINERLVSAQDKNGKTFPVVVGRNENFVCGDVINVKPHPTEKTVWTLIGNPPPHRRRPLRIA